MAEKTLQAEVLEKIELAKELYTSLYQCNEEGMETPAIFDTMKSIVSEKLEISEMYLRVINVMIETIKNEAKKRLAH